MYFRTLLLRHPCAHTIVITSTCFSKNEAIVCRKMTIPPGHSRAFHLNFPPFPREKMSEDVRSFKGLNPNPRPLKKCRQILIERPPRHKDVRLFLVHLTSSQGLWCPLPQFRLVAMHLRTGTFSLGLSILQLSLYKVKLVDIVICSCLLYTSPSPRD